MASSSIGSVLILGGSRFIGVHLTRALLERGARVTHFRRGVTRPPFPIPRAVRLITGDRRRRRDLESAFDREYSHVFDLSGYEPGPLADVLASRGDLVGHYLYCSTSSVFLTPPPAPYDERSPQVAPLAPGAPYAYGPAKLATEDLLLEAFAKRGRPVTLLRPQSVLGPGDAGPLGHALRAAREGLAIGCDPIRERARLSMLDVRDLIHAFVLAAERSATGVYCLGGDVPLNLIELIVAAERIAGRPIRREPAADGPAWWHPYDLVPDTSRARAELGLVFTPLADTLASLASAEATTGASERRIRRAYWAGRELLARTARSIARRIGS